jgi:WXG100 family type VII secretion target
MPETHVRIDFDELTQIAANFSQSAADTGQLTQEIGQTVVKLYDGDWEGRGAQAFYAEAADTLFPAMERLSDALQNAGEASHQIIRLMQEAEERAAREFDGGGGGIPGRGRHQSGNPTGIGKITDIKWNPVKNAEPFVSDPNHPGEPAIHPNDVKQGQIADCFVVSPLAALAQNNPDLIKRAIRKNDPRHWHG